MPRKQVLTKMAAPETEKKKKETEKLASLKPLKKKKPSVSKSKLNHTQQSVF